MTAAAAASPLFEVLQTVPGRHEALRTALAGLWSEPLVDSVLFELCRLRIAQMHRCESELAVRYRPAIEAGLTEEKVDALPSYYNSDLFSERERLCLQFTEQFELDAHSITDEFFAKVAASFSSPTAMTAFLYGLYVLDLSVRVHAIRGVGPSEDVLIVDAPGTDSPLN